MKKALPYLFIAPVLALAGLLLWPGASAEEQARPVARALAASASHPDLQLLRLRAEMVSLRAQVVELRADGAGQRPAREPARAPDEGTEVLEPVEDPYVDIPPAEWDAAIAGDLDAFMTAEVVDSAWRGEIEALIATAVANAQGVELEALRCHSTMCQASLVHSSTEGRQQDIQTLTMQPPFNTTGFVHIRDTSPPKSAISFARAGHLLPQPGPR